MERLDELASVWWQFHGEERAVRELTEEEYERMDAADEEVERLSQQVASLTELVAALARRAPDAECVAYVGTWVLEDAEAYVGAAGIREVLASLDAVIAERVASGYLPDYGLPRE